MNYIYYPPPGFMQGSLESCHDQVHAIVGIGVDVVFCREPTREHTNIMVSVHLCTFLFGYC